MATRIRSPIQGLNEDQVEAIILANAQLGQLSPAVTALISAASVDDRDRSRHTGEDPATNIRMPNGQTLAEWFAVMEAFKAGGTTGPSAPSLTTAPTLSIGPQGVIQSGGYETAGSVTSHPITFTSTMVAGHFAWVGMMTAPGGSITSVTDNLSGAWTAVDSGQGSSTARLIIYYRANLPTGVTGITIVTPSTEMLAIWQERDDIQTSSPKDVSTGAVWTTTTSYSSGSVAATTGDGIAIGITETEDGSGITLVADSPWVTFTGTGIDGSGEVHSSGVGGFVAAARTTTNGTTPAFTGTASTSSSGWACIVVFKKLSTGSVTVGDDVTITPGSVTDGDGGDHTNEFLVMGIESSGVEFEVPGTKVIEASGDTSSFKVGSILYQKRFYAVQTPIDITSLQRGNSKSSEVTAVVGGTLPTNSVAPSLSPTGSQASGTELTISVGTWSGAAEYGIQVMIGGVPLGNRVWQSGTTYLFTPNDTHIGLGVTANVMGRSTLGLESATVNASNTVTVSGSPTGIVYTAAPTWPANLYLELQADFTDGTITGSMEEGPGWDFYRNGTSSENLMPRQVLYPALNAHNSISLFTPKATEGVVVGDTIYILEKRRGTDGVIYSTFSSGKVVTAAPATLALTLSSQAQTGFQFTAGSSVTSVAVGTIVGGTGPFNVSSSGLSSIGLTLSINSSTVVLNGTPSVSPATDYLITVTDSVGASTSETITITVTPTGVVPLPALAYSASGAEISGDDTQYNGITPKYYTGLVVLGPNGDGRNRHRLIEGAPSVAGGVRNEITWFGEMLYEAQPVWFAFDLKFDLASEFPASSASDDQILIFQTHTFMSGNTQPDIACFLARQTGVINWRLAGQDAAPTGSATTTDTQAGYFGAQTLTQDLRYRFIVEMVPGWLTAHGPKVNIWARNGIATTWTHLVNNNTTVPNTYNHGGFDYNRSYFRLGGYKWTGSTWNNSPISFVLSPLYLGRGIRSIRPSSSKFGSTTRMNHG